MAIRRGDTAKELIARFLVEAFPGSFALDKKIYVMAPDGNKSDLVQIAISLTMPKIAVAVAEHESESTPSVTNALTELSAEDKQKIADLLEKLGIKDNSN